MKKSLVRKGLVLGIIVLLVGASIVPSIGGDIDKKSTAVNIDENAELNSPINLEYESEMKEKSSGANKNDGKNLDNPRSELVAYWSFNEGSGNTAYDYSVYGNDGTIYGATWTTGISGYALDFDGDMDYVQVPDSTSLDITQEITLSAWVKFDSISGSEPPFIVFKWGGDTYNELYKLGIEDYGTGVDFRINDNPLSGGSLSTGVWYHLAGTFNGTAKKIYINGNYVIEETQATTIGTSNLPLFIGIDCESFDCESFNIFNQEMDGIIDEVRIYNGALNDDEIEYLYNNPGGGGNQPPVADAGGPYFGYGDYKIHFDGSTSYDNDGMITGFRWDFENDGVWDTTWSLWPKVIHTYNNHGNYTVKLQVKDNDMTADIDTATVEISEEGFYFVHLTDTHIGSSGAAERLDITLDKIRSFSPSPDFIVISGDLAETGAPVIYDNFKSLFYGNSTLLYLDAGETVPVYISPGNHDHRWTGLIAYNICFDYPGEEDDHCYVKDHGDLRVLSMDSGSDDLLSYIGDKLFPEGTGLSWDNINWLGSVLSDDFNEVIFMHHPVINNHGYYELRYRLWWPFWYWVWVDEWDDGCISTEYKSDFLDLCEQYKVPLVLCGHEHRDIVYSEACDYWNKDGLNPDDDNDIRSYYSTSGGDNYQRTLYIQTDSVIDTYSYRIVKVYQDNMRVYSTLHGDWASSVGITYPWLQTPINFRISNNETNTSKEIVRLHVYDSLGNHIGLNETDEIENQINGGMYSTLIGPLNNLIGVKASVNHGDDDYIYVIEKVENYTGNETSICFEYTHHSDGLSGNIIASYINMTLGNDTIIKIYDSHDSIDHTAYVDDDGDGIVDRDVLPDNITYINVPNPISRPLGSTYVPGGVSSNYSVNTTDPENNSIFYFFDWGDGTNSSWLGPYSSGETCTADHIWTSVGFFNITVKARDTFGYETEWSDPLNVTISSPNNPPNTPSVPDPYDGETGVDIDHDLSWIGGDPDPEDTVTYDVYFEADDPTPDELVSNNQSGTTYDPSTMDGHTQYYWKVVAWDNHGAYAEGLIWDFTTENNPPNTPSNPNPAHGVTGVDIDADVSWIGGDPDPGDTVTYDVYFEADDPTPDVLVSNDQTETTFDPGTLQYETTYFWQIIAEDEYGAVTNGPVWSFTTEMNYPPMFDFPTPANGSVDQPLSFTWSIPINDPEGDSFDWNIDCGNGQSNGVIGDTNGTKTLALTDLSYTTTYTVWVNATDPGGSGLYTREWFTFTTVDNNPPNTPSNPDPEDGEEDVDVDRDLSWSCSDPDGDNLTYDVYFEADDPTPDVLVSDDQSETTFDPGTLDYETTYYWQIIAEDEYGAVTNGPVWSFTTEDNTPPTFSNENPPDVSIDVSVTLSELTVTIEDLEGDSFDWSIETSPNVGSNSGTGESNDVKICTISDLEYGETYTWYVNATDPEGSGQTTAEVYTFTIEPYPPPNAPDIDGPTSGKAGTSYTYTFTSTDPNGGYVSYYIEWDAGGTTTWTAFQPSGPPGYSESHNWPDWGAYIIRAKAKNEHGAESDWATLEVEMPVNQQVINPLLQMILEQFPNAFPILRYLLGL